MRNLINSNTILWAVFLSLLAVLLPHTAWAFGRFEPIGRYGQITASAAAFSFEAAIAVLVHKLSKHIEATPRRLNQRAKFTYRYVNAYSLGLVLALGVSMFANLSHAVEFGQPMRIVQDWGVPLGLYAVAFGAVLPFVSLLFARVLSNVNDAEQVENPELDKANTIIRELRGQLRSTEQATRDAEQRALAAEQRFGAAGDLLVRLFAEDKRERILAASQLWPGLSQRTVAQLADTSPSYVHEVLSNGYKEAEHAERE
jgi:uncharacterized membrane protein